jgi:DNA mismatch repair protein MutS2
MIENTIRTIKEAQADKELTRLARQELTQFKDTLDDRQDSEEELKIQRKMERIRQSQERREQRKRDKFKNRDQQPAPNAPDGSQQIATNSQQLNAKRSFKLGDTVRLIGQTQVGDVISINKNDITVAFGHITSIVKANRLEPAEAVKVQDVRSATYVSKQTHDDIYNRKLAFKPDIDVRGMRGDEAIQTVMHFIDDATLIGMSRVRILHGTGNGILRNLIRQYLHTVPAVKDYHDEHIQFGGHGITVVDLG